MRHEAIASANKNNNCNNTYDDDDDATWDEFVNLNTENF